MGQLDSMITRAHDERGKTWHAMRALLDAAEGEKRSLSADEDGKWSELSAQLDEIDGNIRKWTDLDKRNREADEARAEFEKIARANPTAGDEKRDGERNDDEALARKLVSGEVRAVEFKFKPGEARQVSTERRDLTYGTNSAGGYTVPTSFLPRLYEHLIDNSAIRQTNVTVLNTDSGEPMLIPKTAGYSSAALVAEGGTIGESDPSFGQARLDAYKYAFITQISSELLADSGVDVLGFLARQGGVALANGTGAAYVTGDGSSKPQGIVPVTTLGVTAAGVAAITTDELIDLQHSVIAPYRRNGTWMMKDATVAKVRKLKDSTNQYLWQPGLVAGSPDQLLGRPVVIDPNMPAATTGLKSVIFGDFSSFYIRDVNGVRVERSDDFAFNTDLATFRFIMRTDSELIDTTGAVKHLIQA